MHKIRLYSPDGVLIGENSQYIDLAYTKTVNQPGLCSVRFRATHPFAELFERDCQMEIYRRRSPWITGPEEQRWTREFICLFRKPKWESTAQGDYFIAGGPGILSYLGRRHVLYYANQEGLTKFTSVPAETILKTMVDRNAGVGATMAGGRLREGSISGITVEADQGRGNVKTWFCAWDNLQDSMLRFSQVAGGDYDLVKTSATTYEFRYYPDQLGTDRTLTVRFGSQRRNLQYPVYEVDESNEKTVAIAGGKGEGTDRMVSDPVLSDYWTSQNDIETFIPGTQENTVAALDDLAGQKLIDLGPQQKIGFEIRQTRSCTYGEHYFLGDLASVIVRTTSYPVKLSSITVTDDASGKEAISVKADVL
jgi:hypothetical protein